MEEENAGLPMAGKWDPEKLRLENKHLLELEKKSFPVRIRGYFKLTGPAWLQSAMTLGAGSAAASVIAGASFGYQLLWVQPLAMLLGVFMLAALGNVTLSRGERPYKSFSRELAPWVAFLWALGAIVASAICLTLLPMAYIAFFIMNNKKSYLGKETGSGIKRILLNAILLLAILAATLGSAVLIKTRVIDVIF